MGNLKLKLGEVYKDRIGDFEAIIGQIQDEFNPMYQKGARFRGHHGVWFTEHGTRVLNADPDVPIKPQVSDLVQLSSLEEARARRIDVFHPEVGVDDIVIRGKYVPDYSVYRNPYIGPHEYRSLGLMRIGAKPLTIMSLARVDRYWQKSIEQEGWVKGELPPINTNNPSDPKPQVKGKACYDIAIAAKGEEWRIAAFVQLKDKFGEDTRHSDYFTELGRLLGYREVDIEHFIERMTLIDRIEQELG